MNHTAEIQTIVFDLETGARFTCQDILNQAKLVFGWTDEDTKSVLSLYKRAWVALRLMQCVGLVNGERDEPETTGRPGGQFVWERGFDPRTDGIAKCAGCHFTISGTSSCDTYRSATHRPHRPIE